MKCPNCHSENRETAKYCDECGFPLSGRIAQMTASMGEENASASAAPLESALPEVSAPIEMPEAIVALDDEEFAEAPASASMPVSVVTASEPSVSGPLNPAAIPNIAVPGVNVDADGNEFNPEADAAFEGVVFGEAAEATSVIDAQKTSELPRVEEPTQAAPDVTVDLSGVERLVDENYAPPAPMWRAGDTMEMPAIKGAESSSAREFRAPDANAKGKSKGKIVAIVVVALLAIALAVAGGTYMMELWGGKVVPDTVGKSEADARYLLESKGFSVRTTQVKSDDVEGVVLLMDPVAGSRREEGEEIVIHLSTSRSIPDIVGKTEEEARALMDKEGFERVTYTQVKSNETEGTVLSVTPEAGTKAKAVTAITVEVAQAYTVPDVAGMSRAEAVAALEAEGYEVNVAWTYTEEVAEGTAVSTDPVAGTKHASGEAVTLNLALSRGNELVGATQEFLAAGSTRTIGGKVYKIKSLDGVTYAGNETTNYTVTAVEVAYVFGIAVENPAGAEQLSGSITWTADNGVASGTPAIK